MNDIIPKDFYGVTEKNGIPVVSSRKVAEVFRREHRHVLESIRNLALPTSGLSSDFRQRNFVPSYYKDSQGKKQPEYLLTKDGFTMVAMEFKTVKARQFKEAYINRFNEMDRFIRSLTEVKADFPEFTDAVMALYDEPKHYHFSNEINMINRIVLGIDARQFKKVNGLKDSIQSIRPYLSPQQLEYIKMLQRVDIGLCVAVNDYQQRKSILQNYFNNIVLKKIA